jgi:cupin 2 domain-containing protein
MFSKTHNLFVGIPSLLHEEFFQTLAEKDGVRIERIVSDGEATPPEDWYDQSWDEWVLLVSGGATLLFGEEDVPITLKPGDHIMIPAGCRHRVESTAPLQKTIWLAVHFGGSKN